MFDCCIYFNLTTLTRRVTKVWQDEFDKLGLAPSHGYILAAMAEKPKMSQKELVKLMELDASTITRFIDALVRRGLVEKSAKGKGGTIVLTKEGKRLCREIGKTLDRLLGKMQTHFGPQRFSDFVVGLKNARQSLKE